MSKYHSISQGISLEVASRTDRGLERDDNQDTPLLALLPGSAALAVCDGMGGAAGGRVASATAALHVEGHLRGVPSFATREQAGRALVDAIDLATRGVHALANHDRRLAGMGTTITLAAFARSELLVAQVGDSRAYLFRNGELTQLTRDQTLAQMMVERGQLQPHEVATFPHHNVILQAVGTQEHVDVDLRVVALCDGDVLLVCSDGLHGPVPHSELLRVLSGGTDLELLCDALVDRALLAGGPDNVTCLLARVTGAHLPSGASASVDVTRCVLPQVPDGAKNERENLPQIPEKPPLSALWPLRWGAPSSKKRP